MGRTYKKDKSKFNSGPKLNNHRQLPDWDNLSDYDDEGYPHEDDDEINYDRLHHEKQVVGRRENEPSRKTD